MADLSLPIAYAIHTEQLSCGAHKGFISIIAPQSLQMELDHRGTVFQRNGMLPQRAPESFPLPGVAHMCPDHMIITCTETKIGKRDY